MDEVTDVSTGPCSPNSKYIKPYSVHYTQNGVKKSWDVVESHDSVSILVHNVTRNVFVFVRQFRPAVYVGQVRSAGGCTKTIDTKLFGPSAACTLELCAGIIDKAKSVEEIAREELLEECGYDVPVECLEKIVSCRNSVGVSGSLMTQFYAQVTDSMKVGRGGGNASEGELIELVEFPIDQSLSLLTDTTVEKPVGLLFALMWFKQFKAL